MAIKYKATDPATVRQEDRPAQIQRVKEEYEQAKTAGTAAGAKTSAASGSPLNRDVRDAQVRQAWASRPATERFAPTTSATGPAKAVPRPTTVQRLDALSNRIGQREQQLTNMGLQLNQLETAYNAGDYSAVDKYNALANQYNTVFNQYVADVDSYNKLYRGEYRDQGIRNNYARSQYGQAVKEARQATRDQGSRQLYQQRRQEEALRAPQLTTLGKENEQVVERTPNRFERVIGAGLSGTASGFSTAAGLILNNQFNENDTLTMRRKGASVGAHSQRRISGEEPREAGYTYAVSPTYQQRMARAKLTADGLIDTGRRLNTRSNMQTDIAKEGLGETGQMLVDLGVMAVQMAADIGIAAATGGSMLVPLGIRSYGNGYLTAEQMGFTGDAAQSYALGVAAVEVLSEKMFSVFGIVNKFARGAVTQEMSERVIDGLVKRLASSAGGRTALNRLFTILFSAGSEGLEEVVAGIMEPLIRKYTLDRDVKAMKEIDWQETLYEGLLGGILGGLGGAVDLTNTRPTYWKYYKEGIDESIGRYEAAVKKYGLESKEALQAAKEVWDGGTRKMQEVAGRDPEGRPVTYHQLAALEEARAYGRTDGAQGPSLADSLNPESLGRYLENEEKVRRQEAARREEAARLDAEEKARVDAGKTAQSAPAAGTSSQGGEVEPTAETPQGETVRLDTARSAQNRQTPSAPAPQGVADLGGIPEEDLTQEEKDELAYGSGAVEDLGQYTGLAQRMGAPLAERGSARVASSPAANVARTGNGDITRRVDELAGRLQSKGLQSVERIKADPRMDGMRVGDVIFINERLSGAAAEAATMGHEVVHFAGDFDAQLINDLIAVMRRQGRDIDGLVESKRETYRKQFAGMNMGWNEAEYDRTYFEEEVAADFIGELCKADSETLDRIAAEEPGLIRRIINALRNMLARISGKQRTAYEQAIDRLNAALEKAGQNENAVRTDGGVRYALDSYSPKQLSNWANSKSIVIYQSEDQVKQFVKDALAGKNLDKKMYFGSISPALAGRIKKETGLDLTGYNCSLHAQEIRKINKSHGEKGKETPRGQRMITDDDFANIPLIIQYADDIRLSKDTFNDKPVIEFEKTINGRTTIITYVSDKHHDFNVLTMYSGQNKGNLATAAGVQAPAFTPKTTAGTVPNNSISPAGNTVNSEETNEADLLSAIKQLSGQMAQLTEMLKGRESQGEAPVTQTINSAKTSIKQIPALFRNKNVEFGETNIDIGGGRFDLATDYLRSIGTENMVFDPYNRSAETNSATLGFLQEGNKADTATCANVLNVIKEPGARANVILEAAKSIKPDGAAYFMVYEGDGSGTGKQTGAGWQNNRTTASYVSEIEQYFDNVTRQGKLITARDPKADLPKAAWEIQPGRAIRFSLNDTVETKGNLVALHNLNAEKLGKALDLGGFPMPSIAVTKADIPHTNFGKITLVMDRSTVDPKVNRKNEVYSADAWTPTFPQTEYEADDKVEHRLYRKYLDLEKQYGRELVDELHTYGVNLKYELDRNGGLAGILERERNNKRMKQVYMLDTGIDLPEPTIKETVTRMKEGDIAHNEYFVDALGEDVLREMAPRDGEKVGDARRRWWADHGEEMERVYEEYLRQPEFAFSEEEIANVLNWMTKSEYIRHAVNARNYLLRGPETVTEEPDYTARDEAIAKVDQAAYEEWLENLFAGAEKSSGIYNNKDIFTPSGNRRSFAATHFPVTLENIVKAMATQNGGNSKNSGSFYGVKTLRAGTAVTFRSIPEMHALEDRLQHLTEEEAEQLNKALQDRLLEVMNKIDGRRTYGSAEDNVFIRLDSIGYIMEEIAETGSWPAEKVQRVFGKYSYDLTPEMGQEVSDLLTDIQQMPVNIFEAKPKRVVRFDEVRAAIVPDSTDQALIDRLHEAGVEDVRTYEDGNDASRLEQVNAVPNVRFSLNDDPELERARQQAEYWKQLALKNSGVKDVDKLTRDLMRGYGSRASRSEMSGRMRELEEFLRSGGSEAEARATARQMAEDMLNKAAVPEDAADSEYHAAFRRYFRTNSISVPEELKRGWPDGWGRFRKRYFGRLNLKNDGMDVTKIYREASQQWPDLLPSDEVVMRAQDQLETIAEVLDNLEPNMVNPYGSGPEFDAAVDSLAEDIISSLTRTEEAKGTAREEARRERIDEALEQLQAESGESQSNVPQTAADLIAASVKAKQIHKQTERILRTIELTDKEQGLVNALLSGAITLDELPSGINRRAVSRAYEAKKAARDAAAPVEEYNRQHREALNEEARDACENSSDWKNKKFEFGMEAETPRRIFHGLTKDEAEADKLTHIYVDPIRANEAKKARMIEGYGKQIEALHIDKRKRAGNKVSEAYAVHYVGELEFAIDWLEELPEGETKGGVTYEEAKTLLAEFWEENPNLDKEHVRKAVAEFRRIYNEVFAMWNEARVLNGLAPVDYRKGYFPHFTSNSADTIVQAMARGMGFGVEVAELPTDIAGLTHLFKPGSQWSGHALQRTGNSTDYNVLEGWDRYIETVGNIIYHTEDIQRWRALERTLRYKHGTPGVRDEMDKLRKRKDLTEAEREAEFEKLLGEDGKANVTHLSAFVQWLNEYTNFLAGKRHLADRIIEQKVSRKWYQRIQKLENLVGFNMLAGNIASVTTNFVPMFQALGNVRGTSMLQAVGSYAIGKVQKDVWADGSDFLVNRKGYDPLYTNAMGKVRNAMFAPFNWVDDFVSEVVVRAKYIDELRNGATPAEALRTADVFAGEVIADRTVGELPVIYNSKTLKVITMFQVEANNDLRHFFKDLPKEAKKKGSAPMLALLRSMLRYVIAVYTFNDLFEALFGRRISFDPLNTINDLAGLAFGKKLPNGFEVMAEWIRTKEAPDWDTLFDAGHSDKPLSELAAIGEEAAGNLPFVSGLFGGGRYPVFAFLPNASQTQSGFNAWEDLLFVHENDPKYDWQQIYKMNRNALTYLQPIPFIPGGQLRRTAEGIMAAAKEGSYNLTKKGEILQYPILTTYDKFKAAVFGKNTTKGGKEWVGSDFDSLSVEETEAYIDLVTSGSDGQMIYDILRDLHGDERDSVTKAYALATARLEDGERIRLLDALVSESQGEKFAAMMTDGGLTFRQCAEVFEEYKALSKKGELKNADDSYVYKKAVLATEFADWIDGAGYTDEQKEAITEQYKFWNMVPAEAGNYEKLTAAGVSRDNAVDLVSDWAELMPEAEKDSVTTNQKIGAVAAAGYLSENEKHAAVRSLLKDEVRQDGGSRQTDYDKYVKGYGISVEVFCQYLKVTTGVKGVDRDGDGETDSGSKRDALFAAINSLPLQPGQKTALALYNGSYGESSIRKNAPWLR